MAVLGKEYITTSIRPKFQIPITPEVTIVSPKQTSLSRCTITLNGGNKAAVLPFPTNGLDFKSDFTWEPGDAGIFADILGKVNFQDFNGDGFINAMKSVMGIGKNVFSSLLDNAENTGGKIGRRAAMNITKSIIGDTAVGVALQSSRLAYNPQKVMHFVGPDFKSYNFTFDIVPQNKSEADEAKSWIQSLRQHAAPFVSGNSIFFDYPSYFDVYFEIGSGGGGHIVFRSDKLAMTSWNVKLDADEGMKWHPDGTPTRIGLTLGFKETSITTKTSESNITIMR